MRVGLGGASVAGAVSLVVWRVVAAPTDGNAGVIALLGTASVLVLLAAVWRYLPELVPWSLGGVAAAYGLGIPVHAGSLFQAAMYGVGLLLVAEAAYWSLDEATRIEGEPGTRRPRAVVLLGVVAATLAADQVALGSSNLASGGSSLLVAGVASVVVIIGMATAAVIAAVRKDR